MLNIPPIYKPNHYQKETTTKPFVKITDWWISEYQGYKTLHGIPLDHPGPYVSNTKLIQTSEIVDMNLNEGWVETKNTNYILGCIDYICGPDHYQEETTTN